LIVLIEGYGHGNVVEEEGMNHEEQKRQEVKEKKEEGESGGKRGKQVDGFSGPR
jgi:hypothetical protein